LGKEKQNKTKQCEFSRNRPKDLKFTRKLQKYADNIRLSNLLADAVNCI